MGNGKSSMRGPGSLQLPSDALIVIFTFLESPAELSRVSGLSVALNVAASSDQIWMPFFRSYFPSLYDRKYKGREEPSDGWKATYLYEVSNRLLGFGTSHATKGAWAAETFKASLGQSILELFRSKKENMRFILMGPRDVGKTTILERIRESKQMSAEIVSAYPTMGFAMEILDFNLLNIVSWSVGLKLRPLYAYYYEGTSALIFVVDSTGDGRLSSRDPETSILEDEKSELWKTVRHEMLNAKILVFANYQDMPNALPVKEVAERLELSKLSELRPGLEWYVQGCVATKGKGIIEGLDWICSKTKRK